MPKWRILAVDDEPYALCLISEILKNESCVVETAANASIAWEKLNAPERQFNFAILDRMMPGIDGIELLRMIKADSRLKTMPVVIQSGASSPEQIAEGIEAGAFYYLTKPYVPKALQAIVRAIMADIELRAEVSVQTARYVQSLKY
ncbi:MAG: response regulator, partial [Desulfuromonadales bacterium]